MKDKLKNIGNGILVYFGLKKENTDSYSGTSAMIENLITGGVLAGITYYLYKEYWNHSNQVKIGILILGVASLLKIKKAIF